MSGRKWLDYIFTPFCGHTIEDIWLKRHFLKKNPTAIKDMLSFVHLSFSKHISYLSYFDNPKQEDKVKKKTRATIVTGVTL